MSNTLIVHERTLGDLQQSLFLVCMKDGKPYDWTSKTAKFKLYDASGEEVVAETTTGVTAHPTFTFTADATNNRIVRNDHVAKNGDQVVFTTTGTLPAGLSLATRCFVQQAEDNVFKVSLTRGGTPIDITDAGTGTHTFAIQGSVLYSFVAGDVDTAGDYWAWFTSTDGSSKPETFPNNGRKLKVVISEAD